MSAVSRLGGAVREDVGDRPGTMSRRRFLASVGAGAAGAAVLGGVALTSPTEGSATALPGQWLFGSYLPGCTDPQFDDDGLRPVNLPHCVTPLSWRGWQPESWEALWIYRKHFDAPAALRAGRAFVRFDGVLSIARVYLNGRQVDVHQGGYLPFTVELTGQLRSTNNVLAVVVDGRWRMNVPPELPRMSGPSAIDFYQPAGIYRPVTMTSTPKVYLSDVFACPAEVLTPNRRVDVHCVIDAATEVSTGAKLTVDLVQDGTTVRTAAMDLPGLRKGQNPVTVTLTGLAAVRLWDIDDPRLCTVTATLDVPGQRAGHRYSVRTGLRDAEFRTDGFFLNGRRVQLFGLNRHQWYPYVGAAMPARVQRRDAQILHDELNCNMVRCSHYPQSTDFLDACDEFGLLVWEEIPGWDYVGDLAWQEQAVSDVHDMVTRDRNHPSIIVWGARINETLGQVGLYTHTHQLARQLDPSRPTTGAVTGVRGYAMTLPADQDGSTVFSFNDYTRPVRRGGPARLRPPRPGMPYLVSESVGTLIGPAHFERVDPVSVQQDQAMLHATVHNLAAADGRYTGLLGWCAFDYPSGWFHSVNGMKYPGVADTFRIPKLGAAFYRSQADPARRPVIEPAFYWDFSPSSPPTGPGRGAMIWSNCDRLVVYLDDRQVGTARSARTRFPHLAHPPFLVDLVVPAGSRPELRIDGFLGNRLALRRRFSADPASDTLSCVADDSALAADGSDATRVVVRATDRYGAPRPYVAGVVSFELDGPGELIGDNPFDLATAGGAGAVWVRGLPGQPGAITLYAVHPALGVESLAITTS